MDSGKTVKPYWFQERTLESRARYIVMLGGTGGGKTWWGPIWLSRRIEADLEAGVEGARYLAIGPTSEMTRDQMVPALEQHYQGTRLQGIYWKQSNVYELMTGGKIYFRSADKPERIEGHHVRAAWIDEPGQMKPMIWPIVQARTGFYRAPVLFTGYPLSQNWYYHDVYKSWEAGDTDYEVIQFRSVDNPDYPREEYERARATLPAWMFDMRYDGKFRKPFGLVYPEFGEGLFCEPFEIPDGWPVYVGIDPGVFYGALFLAWNDGTYYAYADYYTEVLTPAAQHAQAIRERLRGQVQGFIYDPARLTDVNELAQHGIAPLYKANNAVLAGIGTATAVIKSGRLKVMRGRCPDFVDQMERYSFPTDPTTGNVAKENPIKKDDHLPDCYRYIVHTLEGAPAEKRETVTYYDPVVISPY